MIYFIMLAVSVMAYFLVKQRKDALNERKKVENITEKMEFYKFRDSVTGQMNRLFAASEFVRRKECGSGAVIVKIVPVGKEYVTPEETAEVSVTLASVTKENVCLLKNAEFIIFSDDCENEADRIFFYLTMVIKDMRFAVGAERFDQNETDFDTFLKKLYRASAAAEIVDCVKAVY